MMQTTRIRRLDRLMRERDPDEDGPLTLTFIWPEDEQTAPHGGRNANESGVAAGGDPMLNSGWTVPRGDGKPSL